MTTFPGSPQILKGGLILLNPISGAVQRLISLQYNPETLSRNLAVQGAGGDAGDRSETLRLKGPPVETIKLEASIDATDQLEFPEQNPNATKFGIFPQLAALEVIIYPESSRLQSNNGLAQVGTLEIAPASAPLMLFVWSRNRIVPVRLTEFSIVEEDFDADLNPIRAKVSLGMRVLSVNDLEFTSKGGSLFMIYQQQKEKLAKLNLPGTFQTFGIGGLP